MRTPSSRPSRLVRALFAVALVALAGCGGGGSSLPNSNGICDSNAGSISLARPGQAPQNNPSQIEIVASTNTDQLNQSTSQFDLNLVDNFGNEIDTGPLTAVSDTGGPHPYTNDFFYAGTLLNGASLQFGRTYNVYLNAPNSACQRGFVGSFST